MLGLTLAWMGLIRVVGLPHYRRFFGNYRNGNCKPSLPRNVAPGAQLAADNQVNRQLRVAGLDYKSYQPLIMQIQIQSGSIRSDPKHAQRGLLGS